MAQQLAEQAAHAYKAGDFAAAIEKWTQALLLPSTGTPPLSPASADVDLKARCLANRAQALLQLRDYEAAERDCAASLRLAPGNVKVLLRLASALLALERVDAAKDTLERALALRPPPSLLRALQNLRKQALTMAAMLQGPGGLDADAREAIGLVDEAQTLRLTFRDPPPASLPWGAWCTVSLFCSNEFGLFRRADFPCRDETRETLPLEFCVYDHGGGYCAASEGVTVEERPLSGEDNEEEEEDDEEGAEGPIVALRRNTSCRVWARVRFLPSTGDAGFGAEATRVVHLRVAVAPSLVSREVLPLLSLPIRLLPPVSSPALPGAVEAVDGVDARLGIVGCRTIYLPALNRALLCAESPGQAGIAGKVWDAGLVLTQYLAARPHVIAPPKRCIELGAGTGAAGIAAALLGAQVVVTDLEPVVPLIERNIDLNIPASSQGPRSAITAAGYAWGQSKAALGAENFDAILMADVVYDPTFYSPLVKALRDLSHRGTVVTLAHRERHPDASLFFTEARRHFLVEQVPFDLEEEVGWRGKGEGRVEAPDIIRRACADVHIFEMRPLEEM